MEIYADTKNANIASWQGAARLRSITLAPISAAADATGGFAVLGGATVFAGAGQVTPTAMHTHNSTPRPGSPPRGSTPLT